MIAEGCSATSDRHDYRCYRCLFLRPGKASLLPDLLMTERHWADSDDPGNVGYVPMAITGYLEQAKLAAQRTFIPGTELVGAGQDDVATTAFFAWTKEATAGRCLDAAMAMLATIASQALHVTERTAPALQAFVATSGISCRRSRPTACWGPNWQNWPHGSRAGCSMNRKLVRMKEAGADEEDSNPHAFRHWNLNPGRLPIPPHPRCPAIPCSHHSVNVAAPNRRPFAEARRWLKIGLACDKRRVKCDGMRRSASAECDKK